MILVDVILPLPLDKVYTYCVPPEYSVQVGHRVIVQFGKRKYYTAIVVKAYQGEKSPEIKSLTSVLDDYPYVLPFQLELWKWIASYYMCSIGEVYRAALPSALKLESKTYIYKNSFSQPQSSLSSTEEQIYYLLSDKKPQKISEIEKELKLKNIFPHIKSLVDKDLAVVNENISYAYSAKTETIIRLLKEYSNEELQSFLDRLSRAKKQQHLLSVFLDLKEKSEIGETFSISKQALLKEANVNSPILDSLIEKGILEGVEKEVSRFNYNNKSSGECKSLNKEQEKAYLKIKDIFKEKDVILLHGVTSSGKTEIYIRLIQDIITKGKRVLYLLPEIALTTQITERLKSVFGDELLVYHSRFNENERAEVWTDLLSKDKVKVILGARSAIFLPVKNLDLIIVDEEHESSYKQQDPAPRYNARDCAIILSNMVGNKVLLGTATPAVETYYNALSGKYGLVTLSERYDGIALPEMVTVDVKELKRKKQMKSILSPPLIANIRQSLSTGKQAILFQNRRGFAPLLECKVCSWVPRCEHCDVSLTYHKGQRLMICHYCGSGYEIPTVCPNCETPTLNISGYGTERIEEETKEVFPDASVKRMDLDTTRSKKSYGKIISDLENRKTDILIGTQMVSKGLDFDNVDVVGILNADLLMNYPDFRAHEKAFQLMTQVSGRAGRKNKRGLVLIQTSQPLHPIISYVLNNDYKDFFNQQIYERKTFGYPPFCRLISIVMKGKDADLLEKAARRFAGYLKESFQHRVFGPSTPPVSRIQSFYIYNILLKIENNASSRKVREAIKYHQQKINDDPEFRSIIVYYDVDPLF